MGKGFIGLVKAWAADNGYEDQPTEKQIEAFNASRKREAVKRYSDEPDKDITEMGLTTGPTSGKIKIPPIPTAHSYARLKTKHHIRHVKEMGYKNEREYEKAAIEFFNSDSGTLFYSEKSRRFYRYDKKAEKVAVSNLDGTIHTFFTANDKWVKRHQIWEEFIIL